MEKWNCCRFNWPSTINKKHCHVHEQQKQYWFYFSLAEHTHTAPDQQTNKKKPISKRKINCKAILFAVEM